MGGLEVVWRECGWEGPVEGRDERVFMLNVEDEDV
jgi:hypothetical protein